MRWYYDREKRYIKKSGQAIWAKTSVTAVRDSSNKIKFNVATIEDITKEKEIRMRLKESENRMEVLLMNAHTGILLENEHGKIQLVNKKYCELFGLDSDPELLRGKDASFLMEKRRLLFKNKGEFDKRNKEDLKPEESIYGMELELIDGRFIKRNYIPIYYDLNYKGNLRSYDDITLNKTYRENIELQKEKFSNIIANMNLGLLEIDNNGVILFANQSFCNMSGYSMDELVGENSADMFLTDEDSKEVINKQRKIRAKGIPDLYEVKIITKKGQFRNWLISGAPNYNVSGEKIGSIGISLDITAQKNLEYVKEQLLISLEKQNKQLNEYAQVVSHDLKSPLRNIDSLINWVIEDNEAVLNEEGRTHLELILKNVNKMDALINGILNYSTIDKAQLDKYEVDTNYLVSEIFENLFVPKHITLTINNNLPVLIGNKFRLQQLFQNLIQNAIKSIDKEEGFVEVGVVEKESCWKFYVKDNGEGISKKYFKKIFNIFQKIDDNQSSTGIGLAIVKRIIDFYGGKIWLESQVSKGTTFYFTIPK
mgnify:CR=1 FL=1